MRFCLIAVLLIEAVYTDSRKSRDIGLHLNHHHDQHGHHHLTDPPVAASQSQEATFRGYGKETPNFELSVDLQLPEGAKETNDRLVLSEDRQYHGYPRDNPSDSFQHPPASGATNVQASVTEKNENLASDVLGHQHQEFTGGEIPGEAGKDFPVFSTVPVTTFDCQSQQWPGYYADEEARCQVFHICYDNRRDSFLCPNGTVFHQKYFVCDWWFNVDCSASRNFFQLNSQIGVVPQNSAGLESHHVGQQVNNADLNLTPQQPVSSFAQQEPNLNYLPPPPQLSPGQPDLNGKPQDVGGAFHHTVGSLELSQSYLPPESHPILREPIIQPASAALSHFDVELPQVSQSYLPPLDDQIPKQTNFPLPTLTDPETVAPIEKSAQDVTVPGTFYLPPIVPEQISNIPDLAAAAVSQENSLAPGVAPSLAYIPPFETKFKPADLPLPAILQEQLPSGVVNTPTAMEALANGILKMPESHQSIANHNVPEPSTDYLPPSF